MPETTLPPNFKKIFVLIDEHTGDYFTKDADFWWSRDIREACEFDTPEEVQNCIAYYKNNKEFWDPPFEKIEYMMIATIFKKVKK